MVGGEDVNDDGNKVIKKEVSNIFRYIRERNEAREETRRTKQLLLAHILYLKSNDMKLPLRYMKIGKKWGEDAKIWTEKTGDVTRICYEVTGTSTGMWMQAMGLKDSIKYIRSVARGNKRRASGAE